jgi:ribonuclease-3
MRGEFTLDFLDILTKSHHMEIPLWKEIEALENKLGLVFANKYLLIVAFTHRSWVNENKETSKEHNERLEFLGDSVLGVITAEYLYKNYPTAKEGDLSYLRSRLVDASTCCQCLLHLEIEGFLMLGKGEMMNSGKGRESLLSNLFEALLGAIYLDQGIEAVKKFFFERFDPILEKLMEDPGKNWKALLQDYYQKKYRKQPMYKVLSETGPHHAKVFCVAVYVEQSELGVGEGFSKKEAEQNAAQNALSKLGEEKGG